MPLKDNTGRDALAAELDQMARNATTTAGVSNQKVNGKSSAQGVRPLDKKEPWHALTVADGSTGHKAEGYQHEKSKWKYADSQGSKTAKEENKYRS
jgi:hypothetical protein